MNYFNTILHGSKFKFFVLNKEYTFLVNLYYSTRMMLFFKFFVCQIT